MNVHPPLSEVLDLCVERVQAGETVEACIADYPEYEGELRDELEAAALFSSAFAFPIDQDRKRAARLRMHATLDRKARGWRGFRLPLASGLFATGTRVGMTTAAIALMVLFSGTGTVLASQSSVPGDVLYPVKRTTESVRLALALSESQESALLERYTERRIAELEAIATEDKERFVAGLVNEIIDQTDRARVIASAPVEQIVQGHSGAEPTIPPTSGPGTPDPSPQPTATPTPSSDQGRGVGVSLATVLDLKTDLSSLQSKLADLEGRVNTAGAKGELEKLQKSIERTQGRIDNLLRRVDNLRDERPSGQPPEAPIDQDDPDAPAVTPTATPTIMPSFVINGRPTAIVMDVSYVDSDGVSKLDIRALQEDGSRILIEIKKGGTVLLKNGREASAVDLAVGQTLVLSFERGTGRVLAASIVPGSEFSYRNGRGTLRREGDSPTVTVVPSTAPRDADEAKIEEERRRQEERDRQAQVPPEANEDSPEDPDAEPGDGAESQQPSEDGTDAPGVEPEDDKGFQQPNTDGTEAGDADPAPTPGPDPATSIPAPAA